jgi:hypothetical protein
MRVSLVLLTALGLAAPAAAQNAPMVLSAPNTTPTFGWGADAGGSGATRLSGYAVAQRLIAEGRYAEADPMIDRMIARTDHPRVRFLKGVNALGLGDPATARRYFLRALPVTRNGDPGAMSGLAIAEARLGNQDAARAVLVNLRRQQEQCRSGCDRRAALSRAIGVVEKVVI